MLAESRQSVVSQPIGTSRRLPEPHLKSSEPQQRRRAPQRLIATASIGLIERPSPRWRNSCRRAARELLSWSAPEDRATFSAKCQRNKWTRIEQRASNAGERPAGGYWDPWKQIKRRARGSDQSQRVA